MSISRTSLNQRALARVGTVVGKYRIVRLIGTGGMAAVYAATHRNGHRVALKFLLERHADDEDMAHLFQREAYVANRVDHPGAVPVLDDDRDENGCAFLVMPLLEGETLRARWERAGKRLPVDEACLFASDVLDVLERAHANGIVHRDIKPDNLFLTSQGHVHVLDFGIARYVDGGPAGSLTSRLIGTPAFMPPEQAMGQRDAIGPHSDIWAVGATLFTWLSSECVHEAENANAQLVLAATRHARSLAELVPDLSPSIAHVVDKALAFAPADRWPSAAAMREALGAAFQGELESTASRIRGRVCVELSPVIEETAVAETRTRERGAGIELRAAQWNFLSTFRSPQIGQRLLAKHGFGYFTADGRFIRDVRTWVPQEAWVAVLREVNELVGPAKMMEFGKKVPQNNVIPPTVTNIHALFDEVDAMYHRVHRSNGQSMCDPVTGELLDGVGHFRRIDDGSVKNRIGIECSGPYPCDMEKGIILGFARTFERLAIVEHAPGSCRKDGAERCVYHVTW
ncbi:protein kinase [Pendulispora brunnea]|uniref:Protein kinase n=1 Tax=Pendulispora brunnea TaxID=2905690 RepID=A0ABZ2K915_9BACT